MICPDCEDRTEVEKVIQYDEERRTYRRRVCPSCGLRISTDETIREGSETRPKDDPVTP